MLTIIKKQIQIQHLLKLNSKRKIRKDLINNSNTTLVKVKLFKNIGGEVSWHNSNTTLVKVKLACNAHKNKKEEYSNTTLVKVKFKIVRVERP